jgi:hypothetical protein
MVQLNAVNIESQPLLGNSAPATPAIDLWRLLQPEGPLNNVEGWNFYLSAFADYLIDALQL